MNYNDYLNQQGYSKSSQTGYTRQTELFKKWCKKQHTSANNIDYKTTLKYIKYLTQKGNSKKTINHKLGSLKIYFNYLIQEAYRTDNPLEQLIVKGTPKTIHHNLLSNDELEDLYYSYESPTNSEKRNKIVLGLLVYQGLSTTDLSHLKTEDLQLSKGKIYIASTLRSNARTLELKPWQIMEAIEYVNTIRPQLQKYLKNYSDQLFIINARFTVITSHITKQLKKQNQKFTNVKQLRASVITLWLNQYNIRKVQHLAGHRYISSTERYKQDNLEELHEMINTFHPIK